MGVGYNGMTYPNELVETILGLFRDLCLHRRDQYPIQRSSWEGFLILITYVLLQYIYRPQSTLAFSYSKLLHIMLINDKFTLQNENLLILYIIRLLRFV